MQINRSHIGTPGANNWDNQQEKSRRSRSRHLRRTCLFCKPWTLPLHIIISKHLPCPESARWWRSHNLRTCPGIRTCHHPARGFHLSTRQFRTSAAGKRTLAPTDQRRNFGGNHKFLRSIDLPRSPRPGRSDITSRHSH